MSYAVKEIFLTLQGEGGHAGRAAVFCRFSGCNLWSGRERTAPRPSAGSATPISSASTGTLGRRYTSADDLADTIAGQWRGGAAHRLVLTAASRCCRWTER